MASGEFTSHIACACTRDLYVTWNVCSAIWSRRKSARRQTKLNMLWILHIHANLLYTTMKKKSKTVNQTVSKNFRVKRLLFAVVAGGICLQYQPSAQLNHYAPLFSFLPLCAFHACRVMNLYFLVIPSHEKQNLRCHFMCFRHRTPLFVPNTATPRQLLSPRTTGVKSFYHQVIVDWRPGFVGSPAQTLACVCDPSRRSNVWTAFPHTQHPRTWQPLPLPPPGNSSHCTHMGVNQCIEGRKT